MANPEEIAQWKQEGNTSELENARKKAFADRNAQEYHALNHYLNINSIEDPALDMQGAETIKPNGLPGIITSLDYAKEIALPKYLLNFGLEGKIYCLDEEDTARTIETLSNYSVVKNQMEGQLKPSIEEYISRCFNEGKAPGFWDKGILDLPVDLLNLVARGISNLGMGRLPLEIGKLPSAYMKCMDRYGKSYLFAGTSGDPEKFDIKSFDSKALYEMTISYMFKGIGRFYDVYSTRVNKGRLSEPLILPGKEYVNCAHQAIQAQKQAKQGIII